MASHGRHTTRRGWERGSVLHGLLSHGTHQLLGRRQGLVAALFEVAQAHQHGGKEVGGEEQQEVDEVGEELRVDPEAQASLVGDDEGDDGLENGGEECVDAEDQGAELLRKRSRDLKT